MLGLAYRVMGEMFLEFLAVGFNWLVRVRTKPPVPANSIAGKLLFEWITLSKVASLLESAWVEKDCIIAVYLKC